MNVPAIIRKLNQYQKKSLYNLVIIRCFTLTLIVCIDRDPTCRSLSILYSTKHNIFDLSTFPLISIVCEFCQRAIAYKIVSQKKYALMLNAACNDVNSDTVATILYLYTNYDNNFFSLICYI